MQLVTFAYQGQSRLGACLVRDGRRCVIDLHAAQPETPAEMKAFLNAGERAQQLAQQTVAAPPDRALRPEDEVRLLAPVLRPGKIICLGHNYFDHMGQAIVLPAISAQVDYEAELAVVIGRSARHVPAAQALDYVVGYTIFNDVSARDIQKRSSQWMLGKSFDTFGPMGPALVTPDEIPDPHTLELSLTHNDLERQHTNTRHMIFSIPMLIAYLSEVMTLEPGDVISTGTPAKISGEPGVPTFMKPGDTITIQIEQIGELINPVVAEI